MVNEADKLAGDWNIGVLDFSALQLLLADRCIYGVEDKRRYCPTIEVFCGSSYSWKRAARQR
jgi:hypothetical protein